MIYGGGVACLWFTSQRRAYLSKQGQYRVEWKPVKVTVTGGSSCGQWTGSNNEQTKVCVFHMCKTYISFFDILSLLQVQRSM